MAYQEILIPRFDIVDEEVEQEMLKAARIASTDAYAPHSGFPVGAVVRVAGTNIKIPGANIESDSFGLTQCAERVAIQTAIKQGHLALDLLAVSCPKGDPLIARMNMPCGACRQVASEHMGPDTPVLVDGVGQFYIGHLLPMSFQLDKG